jgi:acyl-CoA thioester hydrolase
LHNIAQHCPNLPARFVTIHDVDTKQAMNWATMRRFIVERYTMAMFNWHVRVYYEDTDTGGIVYYANYLKFFERARTEWLRHTGFNQQAMAEQHGLMFVVKSALTEYLHQLRLTVEIEKVGRASISFSQFAWRGDTCLASAKVVAACVARSTMRVTAMPREMYAKMLQDMNQAVD